MAGVAEGVKDRLWPGRSDCSFGTDPRIYQTTVKEFHKDKNGKLNGLTIVRLESKVDEKTGRRNMVEVAGSEKKIPAELVLIAAGFWEQRNTLQRHSV